MSTKIFAAAAFLLLLQCPTAPLFGQTAVERTTKLTVLIETEDGVGSGIIIGRGNHILTAAHVATEDHLIVRMEDNQIADAEVIWRSIDLDLAILKTPVILANSVPTFANPDEVGRGIHVFAIGFPWDIPSDESAPKATVTKGIVSRFISDENKRPLIQIDAPVNPGNSGGPLVDEEGHILGIVVKKRFLGPVDEEFVIPSEGIAYAVPANLSWKQLESLSIPFSVYTAPEPHWYDSLTRLWEEQTAVAIVLLLLAIFVLAIFILLLTKRGRSYARETIAGRISAKSKPAQYEIHCTAGQWKDRRFPIDSHGLVIGRDRRQASIILDTEVVSKRHCRLDRDVPSDRILLTDEGSTNGTYVNGKLRLHHQNPYQLHIGDEFSVGSAENIFKLVRSN